MAPGYWHRGQVKRNRDAAQRRPGAMAPGYLQGGLAAVSRAEERSTKTGGHGPRLSVRCRSIATWRWPLNEDRGPWPPVIRRTLSLLPSSVLAQRRPGAMAPGYYVLRQRPGVILCRSTKTGGHGPRLYATRPFLSSTWQSAQRRPGAMAPGYFKGSRRSIANRHAQRRPGAMAPGYPGRAARQRGPRRRSTKTGGHGPRLFDGAWATRIRGRALNEDRGPWPPVISTTRPSA